MKITYVQNADYVGKAKTVWQRPRITSVDTAPGEAIAPDEINWAYGPKTDEYTVYADGVLIGIADQNASDVIADRYTMLIKGIDGKRGDVFVKFYGLAQIDKAAREGLRVGYANPYRCSDVALAPPSRASKNWRPIRKGKVANGEVRYVGYEMQVSYTCATTQADVPSATYTAGAATPPVVTAGDWYGNPHTTSQTRNLILKGEVVGEIKRNCALDPVWQFGFNGAPYDGWQFHQNHFGEMMTMVNEYVVNGGDGDPTATYTCASQAQADEPSATFTCGSSLSNEVGEIVVGCRECGKAEIVNADNLTAAVNRLRDESGWTVVADEDEGSIYSHYVFCRDCSSVNNRNAFGEESATFTCGSSLSNVNVGELKLDDKTMMSSRELIIDGCTVGKINRNWLVDNSLWEIHLPKCQVIHGASFNYAKLDNILALIGRLLAKQVVADEPSAMTYTAGAATPPVVTASDWYGNPHTTSQTRNLIVDGEVVGEIKRNCALDPVWQFGFNGAPYDGWQFHQNHFDAMMTMVNEYVVNGGDGDPTATYTCASQAQADKPASVKFVAEREYALAQIHAWRIVVDGDDFGEIKINRQTRGKPSARGKVLSCDVILQGEMVKRLWVVNEAKQYARNRIAQLPYANLPKPNTATATFTCRRQTEVPVRWHKGTAYVGNTKIASIESIDNGHDYIVRDCDDVNVKSYVLIGLAVDFVENEIAPKFAECAATPSDIDFDNKFMWRTPFTYTAGAYCPVETFSFTANLPPRDDNIVDEFVDLVEPRDDTCAQLGDLLYKVVNDSGLRMTDEMTEMFERLSSPIDPQTGLGDYNGPQDADDAGDVADCIADFYDALDDDGKADVRRIVKTAMKPLRSAGAKW